MWLSSPISSVHAFHSGGTRGSLPLSRLCLEAVHANEIRLANCTFSCTLLPSENTFAMTAGGGLDLRVHRHFAIRVIQAEYLMTRFTSYTTGTTGTQNDMRLSSGIVFRFGRRGAPPLPPLPPLAYSCSVNPSAVFAGDPIADIGHGSESGSGKDGSLHMVRRWRNGDWCFQQWEHRHEWYCSRRVHTQRSCL